MKTVEIGKIGEDVAARYLQNKGYRIVDRNVHIYRNEIDIIAIDKEYIVFVEVKTRSTAENLESAYGTPAMAVDRGKRKRTATAAHTYWMRSKFKHLQPRLDIIEVYISRDYKIILEVNHFENAFGA